MRTDIAGIYADFSGLNALKARSREDKEGSIAEVARQFESLLLQMMLKTMRQAGDALGTSQGSHGLFYRDLHDRQLAMHLTGSGGMGLAPVIERQLSRSIGQELKVGPGRSVADYFAHPVIRRVLPQSPEPATTAEAAAARSAASSTTLSDSPAQFLRELWPHAQAAAAELGTRPEALLAQAALETGWGRHVMRRGDGASSHNLFGIKASRSWSGPRVVQTTLEFEGGVAVRTRAPFRAYGSFEESFRDYVEFVQSNPRYRRAVAAAGDPAAYFQELQKAGYATDPRYAEKIRRILESEAMTSARAVIKDDALGPIAI